MNGPSKAGTGGGTRDRVRVLVLTTSYPRHSGDFSGSFIHEPLTEMAARGLDPMVLAPHDAGSPAAERMDGIRVRRFRYAPEPMERLAYHGGIASKTRDLRAVMLVPALATSMYLAACRASSSRPGVIHAHWLLAGSAGALLKATIHRPLAVTVHGSDINLLPSSGPVLKLARTVLERSDEVICVSHPLAHRVRSIAPDASINVVPNGVGSAFFRVARDESAVLRLAFVGRLVPEKGLDSLLKAVSDMPGVELHVAGDGPMRPVVETLAGAGNAVKYHGPLPHGEMPGFYGSVDALVLPSESEGLPLTVLEAMASGVLVMATPVGGIPEALDQGRCGVLMKPGAADIREAVEGVLDGSVQRSSMTAAARMRAKELYSMDIVARDTMKIYSGLVRDSGG